VSGAENASSAYDGDALRDRVKGTVNGVTTAYVGNYYEYNVTIGAPTSYYYAGSTRVALRTPQGVYSVAGREFALSVADIAHAREAQHKA